MNGNMKSKSIKNQIKSTYIIIFLLMLIPMIYSLAMTIIYVNRYDQLITNVSRANNIDQVVKIEISDEIWDIVAGKTLFTEGMQYKILDHIKSEILVMSHTTDSNENSQMLTVALRTVATLETYVDMLGIQIKQNASVASNEKVLEEVRSVAALVHDILQEYIVKEIQSAAITNQKIKNSILNLSIILIFIGAVTIYLTLRGMRHVSGSIEKSINELESLSNKIASGDLSARSSGENVEEFVPLAENLNIMAGKIQNLVSENIKEQQNLQKAEMKTLQAQITPHFLYNTFDTIIWLAESGDNEQVIKITRAFSEFFRISLSKGHEWITLEQELNHIRHYLTIQKIRYRDILDYEINTDEDISNEMVLKLMLQPLVENAIYHGIKNKRGRGRLEVEVHKEIENEIPYIHFSVKDNGIGFTEERLQEVLQELSMDKEIESNSVVYGLYNVNKRLSLYYGNSVGLNIKTEYRKGTEISFRIPYGKKSGVSF